MARIALVLITLVMSGLAAEAAVLNFVCKAGGVPYRLTLDDDAGTLIAVTQGKETVYGVRGIKKQMGTLIVTGYVTGRGTDFELTYRYSPSITYIYGNGGKRTDDCSVD